MRSSSSRKSSKTSSRYTQESSKTSRSTHSDKSLLDGVTSTALGLLTGGALSYAAIRFFADRGDTKSPLAETLVDDYPLQRREMKSPRPDRDYDSNGEGHRRRRNFAISKQKNREEETYVFVRTRSPAPYSLAPSSTRGAPLLPSSAFSQTSIRGVADGVQSRAGIKISTQEYGTGSISDRTDECKSHLWNWLIGRRGG